MDELEGKKLSKFRLKIPYYDLIEFKGKILEDEDIEGKNKGHSDSFLYIKIPCIRDRKKIKRLLKKAFGNTNEYYKFIGSRRVFWEEALMGGGIFGVISLISDWVFWWGS